MGDGSCGDHFVIVMCCVTAVKLTCMCVSGSVTAGLLLYSWLSYTLTPQ